MIHKLSKLFLMLFFGSLIGNIYEKTGNTTIPAITWMVVYSMIGLYVFIDKK